MASLTLTGNNLYTGDTNVNGGTLQLSGSNPVPATNNFFIRGSVLSVLNDTAGVIPMGNVTLTATGGTINVANNGGALTFTLPR